MGTRSRSRPACLAEYPTGVEQPILNTNIVALKVSVIIPVYNGERTIARAINSVLNQGFDGLEIIVVDDGSADSSASIVEAYGGQVRTLRQPNRGAAAARHAGANATSGAYLAFLDADDEWLPGKLRACVDALDSSPHAVLAYSDMMSSDGTAIVPMRGSPSLDCLLATSFGLFPSAVLVRRAAFERCEQLLREFVGAGAGFEDTLSALLLREQGEFVHVPESLVVYYGSPASALVSKYRRGYVVFRRLVKARYGSRGRGVLSVARRYYAALLFGAAGEAMREARIGRALLNLIRAMAVSPIVILKRLVGNVGRAWKCV
jgi:glycosyltransferase involved in cell wall biosynthesis